MLSFPRKRESKNISRDDATEKSSPPVEDLDYRGGKTSLRENNFKNG
jgi:hypothetical protein